MSDTSRDAGQWGAAVTSYLVTGGSGYFGALVVGRLHAAGHSVRVLDLNDAEDRPPEVEFVRGDVRDRTVVRDAVEGVDVVLNNVAQVPLAKDHDLLRTVNVDGTVNLLAAINCYQCFYHEGVCVGRQAVNSTIRE